MPGTVIGQSMNLGFPGTYAKNADCIIVNRIVTPQFSTVDLGPYFGEPVLLVGKEMITTLSKASATYNNYCQSLRDFMLSTGANGSITTTAQFMLMFLGVAVREVKTYLTYSANMPTIGQYQPSQACDILERGSVSVVCNDGALNAVKAGASVYVRLAAGSSTYANMPIGGFETGVDSGNCVVVSNAVFTNGNIDANNMIEITLLSRNLA